MRDIKRFNSTVLKSKATTKVPLGTVKKILFQLIAFNVIDLTFNEETTETTFSLGKLNSESTELAMNADERWNEMKLFA